MISLSVDTIVAKIVEASKLDEKVVRDKIVEKKAELSGLVSDIGAAHIVANKLGVNLIQRSEGGRILIKDLVPGLRNVVLLGRVLNVSKPVVFDRKDGKGKVKVGNVFLQDESGKTRVVFWNEQTTVLEDGTIKEGKVVKFFYGYVKQGRNDYPEVHLGGSSKFLIDPKSDPDYSKIPVSSGFNGPQKRSKISELEEGRFEVLGTIVSVFEPRFYDSCPECNSKVVEGACSKHGNVVSKSSGFMSVVLDDGSGTIRCTFFRDVAESLLGEKFEVLKSSPDSFEKIKDSLLGSQIMVLGRIKNNERFGNLDMVASSVDKNVDFADEAKKVLESS